MMNIAILNAIDPTKSQVNWGGTPVDAYIRYYLQETEMYKTAVSSVANGRPDNQLMAQWIVNFLQT